MGVTNWLRNVLQEWNRLSDEYSDIMIEKEYSGFMHIVGLYPNVNKVGLFWGCFRSVLVVVLLLFHTVGLLVSLIVLYDINFVYFTTALHYFLIVGIACFYVIHLAKNRHFVARFHKKMYFNFYDYQEGTNADIMEMVKKSEKQKRRYTILPILCTITAACILLLAPILDKYGTFDFDIDTSINFNLPLPMVYVFDSNTMGGYLVALVHQLSSATLTSVVLGGVGYSFIVTTTAIIIQLRILIHMIDTIESRAMSLYKKNYGALPTLSIYDLYRDERFSSCMDSCLRKCVEHHKIILRNFSGLNDFFSMLLFPIFIVAALILALAMVGSSNWKVLPGNTVASLVLCAAESSFFFTVSSLGQNITDLNEDLRSSIYGIKWYYCNKSFCLNIMIILAKTLSPVRYTSGGIINLSHASYANIINSAYSYYNLASATS